MTDTVNRREFLTTGAVLSAAAVAGCAQIGLPDPTGHPDVKACESGHVFANWAHTITCAPRQYCQPSNEGEVVALVKQALANGTRVRTVGAGHSWAPLVVTKDALVNLDKLQGIVSVDESALTASVHAGTRLKNLTPLLADRGLGMRNLGSIRQQSLAGAVSTGTHGTGLRIGNIPTQIVGLKLVTGNGDVVSLKPSDGDAFQAARISLGALGIVTEVTLQCVKNYDLEFTATWCKFDDVLPQIESLNAKNTRVRIWWLVPPGGPGAHDDMIVSTMNEVPEGAPKRAGDALKLDLDDLLKKRPRGGGSCVEFLRFTKNYVDVLSVPLLPVFHRECEYAIPVENTVEALRALRRTLDEGDLALKLPIEIRFVAGDDILVSPVRKEQAFGEKGFCYIGCSTQDNATEVFQRFEPIAKKLGGRPHWGKCYSLTQAEAAAMYPDSYDRFKKVRKDLDPKGVFANELIDRLFG